MTPDAALPRCRGPGCQSFLQCCRCLSDGKFALIEHCWHAKKAMNHAIITAIRRVYTGFLRALCIGRTLIAQRITLGRQHQGRRQTAEVTG